MNTHAMTRARGNAGHDVIAHVYFRTVVPAITFGVALVVFNRFGLFWGLLSVPLTLVVVIAFYALCYWGIESWLNEPNHHDQAQFNQMEDMSEHLQRINEQNDDSE